jgi:hypothetical protein
VSGMAEYTRREWLQLTGTAVLAASGTLAGGGTVGLQAIEPIQRVGKPYFRLSLAGYSLRDHFSGKRQPAISLEDYVDLAAQWGL